MMKLFTAALLGASLTLAACGGSDEATEADAGVAETDAMSADPTLSGSGDTTSAAGAGAETGAMDSSAGAGMDPGAAGDAGATPEEDAAGAGAGAGAGGAGAGAGAGADAGSVGE